MTPFDLIRLALRDAGVNGQGQSPSDEDMNDAFSHLNMMMGQWNRKRWLVWHLKDVYCVSDGTGIYMVGPGEDFDTYRPNRIEAVFCRYVTSYSGLNFGDQIGAFGTGVSKIEQNELQGVDYTIRLLEAREDYNSVIMKGLLGPPRYAFYDASFPTARMFFYPFPTAGQYELHLSIKEELAQFPDLTTDINMPSEYLEALLYNLAVRLRFSYQMKPDAALMSLASGSLSTIRGSNTQIPIMRLPPAIASRRSRLNVYSGNWG